MVGPRRPQDEICKGNQDEGKFKGTIHHLLMMKRYFNGRFKAEMVPHYHAYDSDRASVFSESTEQSSRRMEKLAEEQDQLCNLLQYFHVPGRVVDILIDEGYGSILRLLRMPYERAEQLFGHRYRRVHEACIDYVQYNITPTNLGDVMHDERKFELMMGGSKWQRFLNGGFRSHEFILISGESALGKTLFMTILALRAAVVGVKVYYLDAEDKLDIDRVKELCKKLEFDKEILNNINQIKSHSRGEQFAAIRHLQSIISNSEIGSRYLIIVDSLTGSLRRELPGNENICRRREIMARCIDCLKKMACDEDVDVIVATTTEVAYAWKDSTANVDGMTPLGGCMLQHSATTRIFLTQTRVNGARRNVMTLHYSLRAPPSRVTYKICEEKGIVLLRFEDDEATT